MKWERSIVNCCTKIETQLCLIATSFSEEVLKKDSTRKQTSNRLDSKIFSFFNNLIYELVTDFSSEETNFKLKDLSSFHQYILFPAMHLLWIWMYSVPETISPMNLFTTMAVHITFTQPLFNKHTWQLTFSPNCFTSHLVVLTDIPCG